MRLCEVFLLLQCGDLNVHLRSLDLRLQQVLLAVHEAYGKAQAAEYAVQTYEYSILPQSKQQVEVALASYESGRADFIDLIDAERMLKDAQMAYYKARADLALAVSNLRLAVGTDVNRPEAGKGAMP